jgi:hypothetical protein
MDHNYAIRSAWLIRSFLAQRVVCGVQEAVAGESSPPKRLNFYIGDFELPATDIEIAAQYREATLYFSPAQTCVAWCNADI